MAEAECFDRHIFVNRHFLPGPWTAAKHRGKADFSNCKYVAFCGIVLPSMAGLREFYAFWGKITSICIVFLGASGKSDKFRKRDNSVAPHQ